jgi:membrane associated rhomboid family serine protease
MSSLTLPIIIATSAFSILAFSKTELMARYQFNAYMIHKRRQWYRFFSHALLHADWMHLIINMVVLFSFGASTEYHFNGYLKNSGTLAYLGLYVSSVFVSSLSTYFKHKNNPSYNAVGASGAVSAVLFAHVLFSPFSKVYLYGLLPLSSLLWAVLYVAYSVWSSRNASDNVNHDAHLWGGLYGVLYCIVVCPGALSSFLFQLEHLR